MEIPKKIERLLEQRVKLAERLQKLNWELEEWIESHGRDLTDSDLMEGVLTHASIFEEPELASWAVSLPKIPTVTKADIYREFADRVKYIFKNSEDAEYAKWSLSGIISEIDDVLAEMENEE